MLHIAKGTKKVCNGISNISHAVKTFTNNIMRIYAVVGNLNSGSAQHVLFMAIVLMPSRHATMIMMI